MPTRYRACPAPPLEDRWFPDTPTERLQFWAAPYFFEPENPIRHPDRGGEPALLPHVDYLANSPYLGECGAAEGTGCPVEGTGGRWHSGWQSVVKVQRCTETRRRCRARPVQGVTREHTGSIRPL